MKNKISEELFAYLPDLVKAALNQRGNQIWDKLCEIRITAEKPVMIEAAGKLDFLKYDGRKIIAVRENVQKIVDSVTNGSMYSVNETIKNGFVTVRGGHRIGFCGTAVTDDSGVRHIKNISSVCIRISHQVNGCALTLVNELYINEHISDILIASPPGGGKTTMLRDICRMLGNGICGFGPVKVGIADERNEIAAVYMGVAQNDIGTAAFVCDGYEKTSAIQMMLRSMTPDVIVTDEIGNETDFKAIQNAKRSGVSVIASAHAYSFDDLCFKYSKEMLTKCFDKIILLKNKGQIDKIYRRENHDY